MCFKISLKILNAIEICSKCWYVKMACCCVLFTAGINAHILFQKCTGTRNFLWLCVEFKGWGSHQIRWNCIAAATSKRHKGAPSDFFFHRFLGRHSNILQGSLHYVMTFLILTSSFSGYNKFFISFKRETFLL